MANQYLLTCVCGAQHIVEPRLAGGPLDCSCGKSIKIPTLRGIRDLPLAHPEKPINAALANTWSPWQGIVMVVGVMLLIGGLMRVGWVGSKYVRVPEAETEQEFVDNFSANIEKAEPIESLVIWSRLVGEGLPEQLRPPEFKQIEIARNKMWAAIVAGLAVVGVGSALIVASLFLGGKPSSV